MNQQRLDEIKRALDNARIETFYPLLGPLGVFELLNEVERLGDAVPRWQYDLDKACLNTERLNLLAEVERLRADNERRLKALADVFWRNGGDKPKIDVEVRYGAPVGHLGDLGPHVYLDGREIPSSDYQLDELTGAVTISSEAMERALAATAAFEQASSPEAIASRIVGKIEGTQMAFDERRPWENPNTPYIPSLGFLWQRIVDVLAGKPRKDWRIDR